MNSKQKFRILERLIKRAHPESLITATLSDIKIEDRKQRCLQNSDLQSSDLRKKGLIKTFSYEKNAKIFP